MAERYHLMQKPKRAAKIKNCGLPPTNWFLIPLCAMANLYWDSGAGRDDFVRVDFDDLLSPIMALVRLNHAEYKGDCAEYSGSSRANNRRPNSGMRAKPETPTKTRRLDRPRSPA